MNENDVPVHATSRCINKEWFFIPIEDVWQIFSANLKFIGFAYNLRILAFTLMSNHFHLLVQAPDMNLSEAVGKLIEMTSRHIGNDSGRINQIFARRFKQTRLESYQHFANTYKYIYQNPVRAGIVERVEDYRYSTLPMLIGQQELMIPVEDQIFMAEPERTLDWLNRPIAEKHLKAMKTGLKKATFKWSRSVGRKKRDLDDLLI